MKRRGHVGFPWKLAVLVSLLIGMLAGCNTEIAPPPLPAPEEATGFEFFVDPVQKAVTVNVTTQGTEDLAEQYLPSDTRILTPEVDIALKDYNYIFLRGNRLVIQTRFENVTEASHFLQPFFFTLNTDTANIKSATAPLVMDEDLGGDGVLHPGEQTSRLTFEVKHKNKPFKFFVDASAVVVPPLKVSLQATLTVPGLEIFGADVAVSGDTLVVGAPPSPSRGGAGSAYIYSYDGSAWTQQAKLEPLDRRGAAFGRAVAIDGDTVVVGASFRYTGNYTNPGSAYIFTRSGTTWTQQAKLTPSDGRVVDLNIEDFFGEAVAVKGDTVVVGTEYADNTGAAYLFERTGSSWTETTKLARGGNFGVAVALDTTTLVVGAEGDALGTQWSAGAVYLFEQSNTGWREQAKLRASDAKAWDRFGKAVAVEDGTVVVGAWAAGDDRGAAYLFERDAQAWQQVAKFVAAERQEDDLFGSDVALDEQTVVVGSTFGEAVHLFGRYDSYWLQETVITEPGPKGRNNFGDAVDISGDTIVVSSLEPRTVYIYQR